MLGDKFWTEPYSLLLRSVYSRSQTHVMALTLFLPNHSNSFDSFVYIRVCVCVSGSKLSVPAMLPKTIDSQAISLGIQTHEDLFNDTVDIGILHESQTHDARHHQARLATRLATHHDQMLNHSMANSALNQMIGSKVTDENDNAPIFEVV